MFKFQNAKEKAKILKAGRVRYINMKKTRI